MVTAPKKARACRSAYGDFGKSSIGGDFMKRACLPIAIILSLCSLQAQTKEIKLSLLEMPPLTMEKEMPGLGHGAMFDIMIEAAKAGKLTLTTVFLPLNRATSAFDSGEIPFTVSSPANMSLMIANTDQKLYAYVPCFVLRTSFFFYKPNQKTPIVFDKLGDLKGLQIGIPRGYYLQEAYKAAGLSTQEYNNLSSALQMLQAGRIALVESAEIAGYYAINSDLKKDAGNFAVLDKPSSTIIIGLTYKVSDSASADIAKQFKTGMDSIVKDGTFRKILGKYWGSSELPKYLFSF